MRPIPSTDEVNVKPPYISGLYICSYTLTLSAFIGPHSHDQYVSRRPILLLVARPDASLPDAQAEIELVQAVPVQMTSLSQKMRYVLRWLINSVTISWFMLYVLALTRGQTTWRFI
jgi:hypothetical protein